MLAVAPPISAGRRRFPQAGVAALVLILVPTVLVAVRDLATWPPSIGLDARNVPVGAAEFIHRTNLPGNFYNDFDDGGYLIYALYPQKRVFQDGRVPYYPESFWREIRDAISQERWETLLERYGVTGAIIKRRPGGMDFSAFVDPGRWDLVYRDDASFVFLRKPGTARKDGLGSRH
jgi:hypothetical protein